jgi:Glycogen debranching enzyme
MPVEFKDGAIVSKDIFAAETAFDVSNNLLIARFDGRGAIAAYSVVNKWDFVSGFYNIISFGGRVIDFGTPKTVAMLGRRQITELETPEASLKITQFLDSGTNAVFTKYTVFAKKDTLFGVDFNIELDFKSYVYEFFASRFSMKNLRRLLFGTLKGVFKGRKREREEGNYFVARNDPWGELYLDIACDKPAKTLEKNIIYASQYSLRREIRAGETEEIRFVLSMGARKDFSSFDALEGLKNFAKHEKEAEDHIASLPSPAGTSDERLTAFYKNLYNTSLSLYKEKGDFKGFLAGIVYQSPARTYFRDGYFTILPVLKTRPELVRNEILTLARGIGKDGRCPSAVKYNFKNWWGDHFDSPSFFAIMLFDYVRKTGDKTVLEERVNGVSVLSAAEKVIERLAKNEDGTGLLFKAGPFNRRDWCDNVFREGYVTYDEALYARALYALSVLTGKTEYSDRYEKVKKAINAILWDEGKGWYVNYKNGDFTEDNLSVDTVLTVLFGIADDARADVILDNMEKLLETRNNPDAISDFGVLSVYPFYKEPTAAISKSSYPYYYHNGGDWPFWSALYAYARLSRGKDYLYPLTRWFDYNLEKGNFTPVEFFSPLYKRGSLLQAWSGAGAFLFDYPDGEYFKV